MVAPKANILMSWIKDSTVLPIHVTQILDPEYFLPPELLAPYRGDAVGTVTATDDIDALAEADVVITDCWPADLPRERFGKFQITAAMLHPSFASDRAKTYLLFAQNAFIEYALNGIQTAGKILTRSLASEMRINIEQVWSCRFGTI